MSEITIQTKDEAGIRCSEVIDAEIVGPFAVHKSRNYEGCWTLTHLATGMTVVNDAPTAEACHTGAAMLMDLPIDWPNIDSKVVKTWDKELSNKVALIRFATSCGNEV